MTMVLAITHLYKLPDGTHVRARSACGNYTLEWTLDDASTGEPLYLIYRDGKTLLRYVYDEMHSGYVLAPSDLQLDDIRMERR